MYLLDVVVLSPLMLISLGPGVSPFSNADRNPVLTLFLIFFPETTASLGSEEVLDGTCLAASCDFRMTSGVTTGFFFLFPMHPFKANIILDAYVAILVIQS